MIGSLIQIKLILLILAMAGALAKGFNEVVLKPVKSGAIMGQAVTAGSVLVRNTVIFVVRRPG